MRAESVEKFSVLGRNYDDTRVVSAKSGGKGFGNTSKHCFKKKKLETMKNYILLSIMTLFHGEMCPVGVS